MRARFRCTIFSLNYDTDTKSFNTALSALLRTSASLTSSQHGPHVRHLRSSCAPSPYPYRTFVAGLLLVCVTEYFVLVRPYDMHILWVSLLVPLLMHRWIEFHGTFESTREVLTRAAAKWHYFLLDFCYYCQALLLLYDQLAADALAHRRPASSTATTTIHTSSSSCSAYRAHSSAEAHSVCAARAP